MPDSFTRQIRSGPMHDKRAYRRNSLDPALQRQIADKLHRLYYSKPEEALPDSLQLLVWKLLEEGKTG